MRRTMHSFHDSYDELMRFPDNAFAKTADERLAQSQASETTKSWFQSLKSTGGFGPVDPAVLEDGRKSFDSDRVSDVQTLKTIQACYEQLGYVLDPHTAVGMAATQRSVAENGAVPHISLSTAHPGKFTEAVKLALKDSPGFDFEESVLAPELNALIDMPKRVLEVKNSWESVRDVVEKQVAMDIGRG